MGVFRRFQLVLVTAVIALSGAPAFAAECTDANGRIGFTADQQRNARVSGIPDARFFGDSVEDFLRAVPEKPGPWLVLSGGGADGAYAAGVLNGWTTHGDRPQFSVVTGISTGAMIAPFAFLGPDYDDRLRENYTMINAGDIFEDIDTPESLLDTWPLRDLVARQATPELLKAIAAEHAKGRRLFVATTNLDSERPVIWNMGAIAAHGGEDGLALFRSVLLASSSVPGIFPPVALDVEADGKCLREMHIDGSVGGPFYVAPEAWLSDNGTVILPSTALYIVLNSQTVPYFEMVQPNLLSLLGRAISIALKNAGRLDAQRTFLAAQRDGVEYHFAHIGSDFTEIAHGAFDDVYMKALFARGEAEGREGTAFSSKPPMGIAAR